VCEERERLHLKLLAVPDVRVRTQLLHQPV
jgi:hypothetical protein